MTERVKFTHIRGHLKNWHRSIPQVLFLVYNTLIHRHLMTYQITKEINIHHRDDGWFYQFNTDEYGMVKVSYYELRDGKETQIEKSFHIPKDCIETFISVLQQLK